MGAQGRVDADGDMSLGPSSDQRLNRIEYIFTRSIVTDSIFKLDQRVEPMHETVAGGTHEADHR